MKSRSSFLPFLFAFGIAAVVGATALTSRPNPPAKAPRAAAGQTINWNRTFEAAMKSAKAQNKPVMIDFYTDWCTVCKKLDRETYTDSTVIAETENWVSIKVNAEERRDVAQAYGVTGYPTIVWAQNTGQPVSILPGFASPDEFLDLMRAARKKI